jgi:Flp pilus assembly protein TadB
VSKERAARRAAREHESAIKAAARAAEAERRERRTARRRAVRRATTDRLPRLTPVGRPTGTLARRRRLQTAALVGLFIVLNVVVWVARPDWAARLGALVVSVLVFPVLRTLLLSRRR